MPPGLPGKRKDKVLKTYRDWEGRDVVLYIKRYQNHILKNHPTDIDMLNYFEEALKNPDSVVKARYEDSYWANYRIDKGVYLTVLVGVTGGVRNIRTALTRRSPRKGRVIWPKKK